MKRTTTSTDDRSPSRRRPKRRDLRRERAGAHARARAGLVGGDRRSLRAMADARQLETHSAPVRPRCPRLQTFLGGLAAGIGVTVAWSVIAFAVGPLTSGENLPFLAGAAVMAVGGIAVLRGRWWHVPHRVRLVSFGVLIAIPAVYAVGYTTQLVLTNADGQAKPILSVSGRADAAAQVVEVRASLNTIVAADELLALTDDQARVRLDDIDRVKTEASVIVKRFGGERTWANPDMASAATSVAQAADIAVLALTDKASLAVTNDASLQDRITARRGDLTSYALEAGNYLRLAAQAAGVMDVLSAPVTE